MSDFDSDFNKIIEYFETDLKKLLEIQLFFKLKIFKIYYME